MGRILSFIATVVLAVLIFTSCKVYDATKFKVDYSVPAKVLQQPLKFMIDEQELNTVYTTNIIYLRNGTAATLVTNSRKDLVKDVVSTCNDFSHEITPDGGKPYGFMRIKIDDYKEVQSAVGPILNGLFVGVPILFGAPFYGMRIHFNLTAEIYDANKNIVKEYEIKSKGQVYVGGYECYNPKDGNRPANMNALNYGLKALKDSLTHDAQEINTKLFAAGPNKFDGLGTFTKDRPLDGSSVKSGTAFVISDKGYLATNFHVVDGATKIELYFKEDTAVHVYNATYVTGDRTNDIAILKIDDNSFRGFDKLPYAITDDYAVGEKVFTIGYPNPELMGTDYKYTSGEINAMSGIENDITMLQISTPIQPGNSGGPLFNEKGDVVGITTSTLNPFYTQKFGNSIPQNVNYAVKSDYMRPLVKLYADKSVNTIADKGTKDKVSILSKFTCRVKIY